MSHIRLNQIEDPLSLSPFEPFSSDGQAIGVTVQLTRYPRRQLLLDYQLQDASGAVLWPDHHAMTPERADFLWQRTCMELFIRQHNHAAYTEFNFSPLARWNAYAFDDYRQPDLSPPRQQRHAQLVSLRLQHYRMQALIDLSEILPADEPLQVGLTAVLQHPNDQLSYWALQHSGDRADFHRAYDWSLPLTLLP
ncbi:MAG: hypothetical protein RL180_1550 [Pseudomonadota bacterium]